MTWLQLLVDGGEREEDAQVAMRSALAAAVLIVLGQTAFILLGLQTFGATYVTLLRAAHAGLALVLLVVLLARARAPSVSLGLTSIYALALTAMPVLWLSRTEVTDAGLAWAPFLGHKLMIIGVGAMVPGPPLAAATLIVGLTALAVAQWFGEGLHQEAQLLGTGEPWVTVIYALMALGLVGFRAHHRRAQRTFHRARAEADALAQLTRYLLALRDLSGSPLQALEIEATLLERHHPETGPEVQRMRSALARLREMSEILGRYDHIARWERGEESLDPVTTLALLDQAHAAVPTPEDAGGER